MWQVAVAAAVAGSGIIAKHIFSPKSNQTHHNHQQLHLLQSPINPFSPKSSNFSSNFNQNEEKDGVFRFSSSGGGANSSGYSCNAKKSRNLGKKKNCGSHKKVKNCGKKVLVRLKRRKVCRNLSEKCDSSLSKDCSSFGWGLGLGMMYMMSAGKADINKLSNTIDQTAKLVDELKSELNKQKSVPCHHVLNFDDASMSVDTMKTLADNVEPCLLRHDNQIACPSADSDYASSVLTEEQPHDGSEMDKLEAELESELLKLPWCHTETSENVDKLTNFSQIERHESVNQSSTLCQSDGVPPAELKDKLSIVLIEQQESQISELESELNLANSKLHEKEDELRALKDCVRRLTEFSLTSVSDEETEFCKEEQCEKLNHQNIEVGAKALVGTKRTMHLRTCN